MLICSHHDASYLLGKHQTTTEPESWSDFDTRRLCFLFFFFCVAEPLPFPPGGGKSFLMGASDDVLESVLGLGDLADLTVTNDETDYSYDVKTGAPCRLMQLTLPFNGQ